MGIFERDHLFFFFIFFWSSLDFEWKFGHLHKRYGFGLEKNQRLVLTKTVLVLKNLRGLGLVGDGLNYITDLITFFNYDFRYLIMMQEAIVGLWPT